MGDAVIESVTACVERALRLTGRRARVLLGIAGAPGSGKSTLAATVVDALDGRAVYVPMDGFHLAQAELRRLGRAARKGAPDTFDAVGYTALLRRLGRPVAGETVYAPEFRRDLEEPVAGAIAVPADVPLVVTEGNYLLVSGHGFGEVAELLDESWYVELPPAERMRRLIARHRAYGKTPADARRWAYGSDERNASVVEATRSYADVVVRLPA